MKNYIMPTQNQRIELIDKYIYTPEEIKNFRLDEAINEHPLKRRPINLRSRIAYREILINTKATTKYILPGQLIIFNYPNPKFAEELEWYDKTPLSLIFGLIKTKQNNIREVGINLHDFPPFARTRVLNTIAVIFKQYNELQFNEPIHKVNKYINWPVLKRLCKKYKIEFAIRMYIPMLRRNTHIIPVRLWPTASFTEGHFAKDTLVNIMTYWRHWKP